MRSAIKTWQDTLKIVTRNRNILLPFIIVGLIDVFLLFIIYLAPHPPLSALLGTPIKVFWGERFLHYPFNLLLIPRLFDITHIVSTALSGVLMTGVAVRMLKEVQGGIKPNFSISLNKSWRIYLRLLVIW